MNKTEARKFEVLDAVVRLNIETGRPVSSGLVARLLCGACSPATIRADMVRLQEEGYLVKPHTSAGRLPTDQGYRAFVDRILGLWPWQPLETPDPVRRRIEDDLRRSADSGNIIKMLATLLSNLSANISIILGPRSETIRARRLEIYPQENHRILMVLVLENAMVRSGQVTLDRDYPRGVLEEAARILSERITGCTVAEIRSGVFPSFAPSPSPADRCASDLFARGRDLFADLEEGELKLEGVANVLDEPEFSDPRPLKSLLRFIESPHTVRDALERLNLAADGQLRVWIGGENPIGDLRFFSLLTSPFDLGGRQGILAVLGPRRMPYRRAFAGIDVLRRSLQFLG